MTSLLVLWMLCFLAPVAALDAVKEPAKPFLRGLETQAVTICRVMQVDVQYVQAKDAHNVSTNHVNANVNISNAHESYVCVMKENTEQGDNIGLAYAIELPKDILGQLNLQDDDQSWVSISECTIDHQNTVLLIPEHAKVNAVPNYSSRRTRRRLAPSIGKSTVLVLRVTYRNTDPSLSADDLAGSIFGLGDHPPAITNLASQMEACSFGQLIFSPAVGDGIVHGVAEISIDERVSGENSVRTLENLVIVKANQQFGTLSDKYEHVIVVVPEENLMYNGSRFLAYAFLRGYISVFSDAWAGRISALAHEIGHNMNLHHAGTSSDGVEYGDESGYMGYGTEQEFKSCFNAQKHWSLGWFQDRALSLDVEDLPWAGYLAAFVDYNTTALDQCVLVNVGESNPRLFMQYNRAKGMNSQTRELGDQVVIVRDAGSPSSYWGLPSWREGGIAAGRDDVLPAFRYPDFGGPGVDLVVKACEQVKGPPDYVRLSIHLDDGLQRSACGDEITTETVDSFCVDDRNGSFFVNDRRGNRTCRWLARNIDRWESELCAHGQDASYLCAETCGKCTDDCHDATPDVTFFVNKVQQDRNCEWLSARQFRLERLCVEGSAPWILCPRTCHDCYR